MDLSLVRYSYAVTETEGLLYAPPLDPLYTMEQPWQPSTAYRAGRPFRSCIPEGVYDLVPFTRSNGQEAWALVNESLRVYLRKSDMPDQYGRYACLIHPGNVVSHSSGCILPGLKRGFLSGERAVLRSGFRNGYACDLLTRLLGRGRHTLEISQVRGAEYVG